MISEILQAIALELGEYSSLCVQHIPPNDGPTPAIGLIRTLGDGGLHIKKIGTKLQMTVTLRGDMLLCRVFKPNRKSGNGRPTIIKSKGGEIDLNAPDSVDQLLAMLKRDLR